MLRFLPLAASALLLPGCGAEPAAGEQREESTASAAAQAEGASPSTSATSQANGALKVSEANDVYTFDYAYPAAAGRIAPLRELLDARMEEAREKHVALAIDARADADEGGYPFNPYGSGTEWQVVANLPDWLSLSANYWEYTGGAHGNSWFGALLWDKQAGEPREPLSLFTSPEALEAVVQGEFCDLLDRQREEKRGQPVTRDPQDWASACIGLDAATVILGSTNRRTFDRIGFLVAPYNAGPYAEGSYEVTLPVGRAILGVVKPEYRSAFSAVR